MKESVLANTQLFAGLTGEQRALVAERMVLETCRAGDLICAHGRPANAMYIVNSGWVRLMTEQLTVLANLGPSSLLGEADVLQGRNYTVTAEAATDVALLVLSATDLAEIVAQQPEIGDQLRILAGATEDMDKVRHLRRLNLMAGLGSDQLRDVSQYLRAEKFAAGQGIYCRGTYGNALFLIEQGQVSVQRPGLPPGTIGAGDVFGISALLEGEPHTSDVAALTDVAMWSLSRSDFERLILRYPSLALNLTRLLNQRLRQSNERAVTAAIPLTPSRPGPVPYTAPAPAPAPIPAVTGLNRAADQATGWFSSRSTGAKLRLIAVILLLIWVVGVAAPALVIRLLSGGAPVPAPTPARSVGRSVQDRVVMIALAADLPAQTTATYTPWPTGTPIPTPTFTPTATPTNTPIPTATPAPTATPIPPTATPIPPTPAPVPVVAQPAPRAVAAAAPVKPAVQFSLVESRRLTPCENRGKHNIFIKIVDAAGNPVDGVMLVQTTHGQIGNVQNKTVTGAKGPGLAEFDLWKGATYDVYVTTDGINPASSDIAQELHSNFADEVNCSDGGGGNTLYHNSFNVIFRKNS